MNACYVRCVKKLEWKIYFILRSVKRTYGDSYKIYSGICTKQMPFVTNFILICMYVCIVYVCIHVCNACVIKKIITFRQWTGKSSSTLSLKMLCIACAHIFYTYIYIYTSEYSYKTDELTAKCTYVPLRFRFQIIIFLFFFSLEWNKRTKKNLQYNDLEIVFQWLIY